MWDSQKSIKKVELDVSERELTLVAPGKYQLAARLPYPVNDGAAAARFVKDKRRLVVTLPVKRPPKPAAKVGGWVVVSIDVHACIAACHLTHGGCDASHSRLWNP